MPSTRSQPLNPQVAAQPAARRTVVVAAPPALPEATPEEDPAEARQAVAKAGGFHESSYELRLGLDVTESEWAGDDTVPGEFDEP